MAKRAFLYLKNKILQNKKVSAVCAGILIAVVVLVLILSAGHKKEPVVLGSGLVLEDTYWEENDQGYPEYKAEGFQSQYGIDISEWVEEVDFRKVKESGIDFVILRVGYRGYETGKFVLDEGLANYLKQASAAKLKIGVYFVSQAVSEEEAVEEVQFIADHVKGYDLEMPVYIDLEAVPEAARTDGITRTEYTKIVQAFLNAAKENGYQGGIYANEAWYQERLDLSKLDGYDLWLAKYTETPGQSLAVDMWQFTNEALVPGCDMWVDLNVRVSRKPES